MYRLSALELRNRFVKGDLSAVEIANNFLKRIRSLDPRVGAFLRTLDERILSQAEALDAKRAAGKLLGKLAGVPVAIKDNIHIEGELSSCASKILENFRAPFGATAVERIEAEDGLLIGKTNMDEFAMGSSTEHSAFQLTHNPWNLAWTPGGSSGGSAAAVAARLCPLSLGSDTGGSIRLPAAFCGITAFKPTYGRVSRSGLVAYGSSLDQIGPLAATTKDIAMAMEVIGGHCGRDSTSLPKGPESYLSELEKPIDHLQVGVPWQTLEKMEEEPKMLFKEALETLKEQGATLVEVDLDLLKYAVAVYYILATAEASTNLARFDGIRYGYRSPNAQTLDEVYDLSKEEGFGTEVKRRILLGTFVLSAGYQDAYYKKAQKVRTLLIDQFAKAFERCAIIAMPTSPTGAFEIGSIQDPLQMYLQDIYTIPSNLAGLPAISVPCGLTKEQKPFGLQLIGPQMADVWTVRVGHLFEQARKEPFPIAPLAGEVP